MEQKSGSSEEQSASDDLSPKHPAVFIMTGFITTNKNKLSGINRVNTVVWVI